MLAHEIYKWHQTAEDTSQYMQGQGCHPEGHRQDGGMSQHEHDDTQQSPGRETVMRRHCMGSWFELRVAFFNSFCGPSPSRHLLDWVLWNLRTSLKLWIFKIMHILCFTFKTVNLILQTLATDNCIHLNNHNISWYD